MRITILNIADKFVLKFKRLFYAQVSEVAVVIISMPSLGRNQNAPWGQQQ